MEATGGDLVGAHRVRPAHDGGVRGRAHSMRPYSAIAERPIHSGTSTVSAPLFTSLRQEFDGSIADPVDGKPSSHYRAPPPRVLHRRNSCNDRPDTTNRPIHEQT